MTTWETAEIEIDMEIWRTMSGIEQARTLIHELGHVYQLVTGLGASHFEYDVKADGNPDTEAQSRNRLR